MRTELVTLMAIGLGGALGTGMRLAISLAALHISIEHVYVATLLANVLGAALIGYLSTRALTPLARGMWMTGFCGGFTTFSLFSYEILILFQRAIGAALAYGAVSMVLWLLAVWGGVLLGQRRLRRVGSPPAPR